MSWTERRRKGGRAQWRKSVFFSFCAVAPSRLSAQRAPVLQQISVPHNYYYREMYLPQVTSGPSSVTWSPDGSELIYSMQGSLWRQRLGRTDASQLTDGPGYDYQPDWSPDGKSVVYTSYRNDALELWLLDLATGATRALIANGAVNLDPRWSPDGTRIAYVSTEYQRRWHVFVLTTGSAESASRPERITVDSASGLPRYYYSGYDHYLSPTWSPDGKELILVSNRGHVYGSGGLWRTEARAGAPMREIRNEETNWKARPDWSPDGRRVVYSSYHGGQRNQLWLTTADGGDPFQLAYCACDQTAPRWAPDGRHLAFISNASGNTALEVVSVPGGVTEPVRAQSRRMLHPVGVLNLSITDGVGRPISARVSVTGTDGRGWSPDTAWRYADDSFDRTERTFEVTYFQATGRATLTLPAGSYSLEAVKGMEYARVVRKVNVAAGVTRSEPLHLTRMIDLPARGWWSGDLHVHMNYGGAYRNDPAHLKQQAEAEDLHVVEDLIVNKEQRIPDVAMFSGRPDPVSSSRTVIAHDEEYHTSWWGHTGHLGLTRHLILPNYAGYANTAAASLYPDNSTIFDLSHAQNGVSGYVHPFDLPAPDPAAPDPLTHGLPVDVALGKVDYLEVLGFSDHRTTAEVWYKLLNTGFRIPAGAGTDAMANYASLRGPVGMNRVFVHSGPVLKQRSWLDALKAGKTFVSNGPLLTFTLNGHDVGDEIVLPAGVHRLVARVSLRSIVPVERLEIVANGIALAPIPLTAAGTRADATIPLPVARSGWFTVRAWSTKATAPVLDLYPFASTSPVYVTIAAKPIRNESDARYFVRWIERLERAADAHTGWNDAKEKSEVMRRLAAAKAIFTRRAEEAAP